MRRYLSRSSPVSFRLLVDTLRIGSFAVQALQRISYTLPPYVLRSLDAHLGVLLAGSKIGIVSTSQEPIGAHGFWLDPDGLNIFDKEG